MSSLTTFLVDPPRWYRWLLGVVAITPILSTVFIIGADLATDSWIASGEVWVSGTVLGWVFIFYFMFDAALSGRVPVAKRRLWVVVLILAHFLAIPFYWYFYLRPRAGGVSTEG